jgi:peptidyl-dipeptidase A
VTSEALVEECTAALRPLEIAANAAWWDAAVDATDANMARRATCDVAHTNALGDADRYAAIQAVARESQRDPLVARQLTILEQAHAPHQVDPDLRREMIELQTDIEARFARHRGVIDGTEVDDNTISRVLRASLDNDERRAAWEASKSVGGEVAADVRALARLRNTAARSLGYRDQFAMTMATTDFDEGRLFSTLDEVDAITRAPFADLKASLDEQLAARFGVATEALRPWHYDDPFFQDAPRDSGVDLDPYIEHLDIEEVTARTFDAMGLDIRAVMTHSDLLPRPGKVQHAFCIDIDREGDVRVLSNNAPNEYWADTMLHEFGHAAYDMGTSRELPWLLRTMHMCLTEGVAMRCGRLVRDPEWLRSIAEVPSATVADLAPRLRAARRAELLVFCRWTLVMIHFERGLYANPDGPHDDRWWDLVERFQLVRRPDERHEPDWAAKIHFSVAPVYYQNYMFGEMIASHLGEHFGNLVDNPAAGAALAADFFGPGATYRWDHLIERATGAPLTPAVLVRDLDR